MTDTMGTASWFDPESVPEQFAYEPGTIWLGRDPETSAPLGFLSHSHVLLTCATRGGKGTTYIVPNLLTWEGSLVCYDPEGENATVTATRRGGGSDFADGKGQRVCVLDPFRASNVPDGYRACFNPLDAIDPESPEIVEEASEIAEAIVVEDPNGKNDWNEEAEQFIQELIMHVVTDPEFEGRRNLITVRDLVLQGAVEIRDRLKKRAEERDAEARASGAAETAKTRVPSALGALFQSMAMNDGAFGEVAKAGESLRQAYLDTPKFVRSVIVTAKRHLRFLGSQSLASTITRSTFSLDELKGSPEGVSLYLVLKENYQGTHFRWVRMMLTLIIRTLQESQQRPACGHNVLVMLDEFAGLQRMKKVERTASALGKFHTTMFYVVQDLGQLRATYDKGWETFFASCGTRIFFNIDDQFSRKYVSEAIGETEARVTVKQISVATGKSMGKTRAKQTGGASGLTKTKGEQSTTGSNWSNSIQRTKADTWQKSLASGVQTNRATTRQIGESTTNAENWNTSDSTAQSLTRQRNRQIGHGTSKSTSESRTTGHSEDGRLLLRGPNTPPALRENEKLNASLSKQRGTQVNENRSESEGESSTLSKTTANSQGGSLGTTNSTSLSEQLSHGTNSSTTDSRGGSESLAVGNVQGGSKSQAQSSSVAESESTTWSDSESDMEQHSSTSNDGTSESVQARPLIPTHEIGKQFDQKHGMALVIIGGDAPFKVQRTPYYADRYFVCWFDPHPAFDSPDPKIISARLRLPDGDVTFKDGGRLIKQPGEAFAAGEPVVELVAPVVPGFEETSHDAAYLSEYELAGDRNGAIALPISFGFNGRVCGLVEPEEAWLGYGPRACFLDVQLHRRDILDGVHVHCDAMTHFEQFVDDWHRDREAERRAKEERVQAARKQQHEDDLQRHRDARRDVAVKLREQRTASRYVADTTEIIHRLTQELDTLESQRQLWYDEVRREQARRTVQEDRSLPRKHSWKPITLSGLWCVCVATLAVVLGLHVWVHLGEGVPTIGLLIAIGLIGLIAAARVSARVYRSSYARYYTEPRQRAKQHAESAFDELPADERDDAIDRYLREKKPGLTRPPTRDRIQEIRAQISTYETQHLQLSNDVLVKMSAVLDARARVPPKPKRAS